MAVINVLAGEIKTATQVGAGSGTLNVAGDGYVILTAAGNGVNLTGGVWTGTINGGIQTANGDGINLTGAGATISKVTVGVTGHIFGGGAGSGIDTDGAMNITNSGFIGGQQNAIKIDSVTNASFSITNTATGIMSAGGNTLQVTAAGGTQTFTNAGTIINAVGFFGAGNVIMKNTGVMADVGLGSGNDTATNTKTISAALSLGSGTNKLTNSGSIGSLAGGSGNDTITNSGVVGNVNLGGGTNVLTNSKTITGQVSDASATSNTITNSGAIQGGIDVNNSGTNKITNSGIIENGIGAGSGADTISNTKTINGNVFLSQGTNKLTNSGTITGNIQGGVDSDTIGNTKTITGNISLNDGANTLTNSGTITGTYTGGTGVDKVTSTGTITGLVDLKAGNDFFTGGNFADTVIDGDGLDTIKLLGGNDTYQAGGAAAADGIDIIDGGANTLGIGDTYDASALGTAININLDTADHTDTFGGAVTVFKNTTFGAFSQLDKVTGFENAKGGSVSDIIFGTAGINDLQGNAGNDHLFGFAGNDKLSGGAGLDILVGGLGKDTLSGGADAVEDRFVFQTLADSGATATTRDLITDFVVANDKIVMEDIDSNTVLAGVQHTFTFLGLNQDFTGVAGQVRSIQIGNATNGNITLVQADTNGDQKADFTVELTGLLALTAANFDFVL